MNTPKIVVFDLGKVLVDFDYGIAARRIAAQCGSTMDEIRKSLDYSPLLFRYETGRLTKAQFFVEICSTTKFCGTLPEFCEFFADIFTPIEPMVSLHEELRSKGMPTYILSNTNDLAIGHIRRSFPFFSRFDGYIFSYEHGSMKPDAKLYEVAEEQSGRRGAEILYLDDRAENVATGVARGWQVILHESPEKTRDTFRRIGLVD